MKRLFATAAAALLIALPGASFASDSPPATQALHESQGPDFSACEALEGQLFGACVSDIAQDHRDDQASEAAADAKDAKKESTESSAQDDEHASANAAAAQNLVDGCESKDGREFGECVSTAARLLGNEAGDDDARAEQAAEHGQGADHRSDNAAENMGRGQSGR